MKSIKQCDVRMEIGKGNKHKAKQDLHFITRTTNMKIYLICA